MCMASLIQCVRQKDQNQQFNSRDLCLSQLSKSSNHSGSLCIIGYCANTWPFFQIKTSRIQTKCCDVFPELPQWLHYQPCKVFFLFVDWKQEHCKVLLILFQMLRQWLHFSRLMDWRMISRSVFIKACNISQLTSFLPFVSVCYSLGEKIKR